MFPRRLRIWESIAGGLLCAILGVLGYQTWSRCRANSFQSACRTAADAGDWHAVEHESAQWSAWDRHSGIALVFRAQAAEQLHQPDVAAALLDQVPDDDPACARALLVRVDLLFKQLNRPLYAVETCQRILRIAPKDVEARRRLTYFYALTLQRQKMERLIRESIELGCETPESYVYLALGSELTFSDGLARTSLWLKRHPDSELFLVPWAIYLQQYQDQPLFAEGTFAGDRDLIENFSKRFPQNLEILAFSLEQRSNAGNLTSMADLLSRLPPAAEQDSRFWRYKGEYHLARNELPRAQTSLTEALKLNPYDWQSRHMLAEVLRLMQHSQEAETTARLAAVGKQIARDLEALPNPANISRELLLRVADFAAECSDDRVAEQLQVRLNPRPRVQASPTSSDF